MPYSGIGFNGLTDKNLGRNPDIAEMFGSDLIRVVVGETGKVQAGYFVTGAVLGKSMLDLPAVLRCAAGAPKLRSIILEMTVKRDETAPVDAVIHREQAAVLESRDYLVQELSRASSFRCHP